MFREVQDEITLAINISGCPCRCKGCHSEYLALDIGEPLTAPALDSLVKGNTWITCVSFMGGDGDPEKTGRLSEHIRIII